jgi:membrane protease YdiL (CAAX protease family)
LFFLCQLFWPVLLVSFIAETGLLKYVYGTGPDSAVSPSSIELARARLGLWLTVLAFPFQIATIVAVLGRLRQARPYHFGFTPGYAVRQVLLGWIWWLGLTPLVLFVHILALGSYWYMTGIKPEEHPLVRLAEDNPLLLDRLLVVISVVMVAPVFEELLFRGVLQPWLAQRTWGGVLAMAGSSILAFQASYTSLPKVRSGEESRLAALQPVLFLGVALAGYLAIDFSIRSLAQRKALSAIYGTALLFAMFHASVWPTPIPLFVLGLGLGWLAFRTQGIVGPIVVHALFNSVAVVSIVLAQAWPDAKGNDVTSAWQALPCPSTSSMVPGSWLPRRTYAKPMAAPNRGEMTEEVTFPTSFPSRSNLAPRATDAD